MRTTFGTFNTATSGLFASQRSLSIVSNNISNANTEGYSRQNVLQRASTPINGGASGLMGTGVETYDIVRQRNEYIDTKYWGQVKSYANWKTKSEGLKDVEAVFNEPSDTGIRKVMDEFFTSIEEVVKSAGNNTNRINMIEKGVTLTTTLNNFGQQIVDNIRSINFEVKTKVDEINALATQITELNKQIFNLELDGHKANPLRDQRGTIVDKLSKIVNISVSETSDQNNTKYFNIRIGGITLVNHYNSNKLTVDSSETVDVEQYGTGEICKIKWAGAKGTVLDELKVESGELRALMDLRDGTGEDNTYRGLPYYLNQLNRFARDFAKGFNDVHDAGYDLNGNAGSDFFIAKSGTSVNCLNIKVNDAIQDDPTKIAASGSNSGESNNENAKKLAEFRSKKDVFYDSAMTTKINGTADDFIKSILSVLSVDANQADRMMTNTESIVEQTNNQRLSESGVSLDEEMTNMLKFQHAYNASARMITTLDSVMNTMINRLGLVGR